MSNQTAVEPVAFAKDMPATLPQPDSIVELCKAAGYERTGLVIRHESQGVPVAWVKYGAYVTLGEARTQAYVAEIVNSNPDAKVRIAQVYLAFQHGRSGYIVMEYIPSPQCTEADAPQVAAVVKYLATIKGPTLVPGPVGGGPIGHRFFVDWLSDIAYESVQHLEAHVNGILALAGETHRVDFSNEAAEHLYLCPCDLDANNFMKDAQGKIVVLDFGATCFLPPSFFSFAMAMVDKRFPGLVADQVACPKSPNLHGMCRAYYFLVMCQKNDVALPRKATQ